MASSRGLILALVLILAGCGEERTAAAAAAAPVASEAVDADGAGLATCTVALSGRTLPPQLRETSGLARSLWKPGILWTHNDRGNGPELFAIDEGILVARVRVRGATALDWEDIESAPCADSSCLYLADIGDNGANRDVVSIHRVPEPIFGQEEVEVVGSVHGRFPDGARDAEALFVLGSEVFLVNKGRREDIALYRLPPARAPGDTVVMERVRHLFDEPEDDEDRVTAATASPDGRWVAIRTYRKLHVYPGTALVRRAVVEPITVDLEPLGESQGEGVALSDDGAVWLSSEAESRSAVPLLSRLQCTLPVE